MIESKLTAKGSKTIKMSAGTSRTNVAVTIFICRRSTPALSIKDFSNGIKEQFTIRSDLRQIMPAERVFAEAIRAYGRSPACDTFLLLQSRSQVKDSSVKCARE